MFGMDGNQQHVYRRELTVVDFFVRYVPNILAEFSPIKKRNDKHLMNDICKEEPFECDFIQGSFLVLPTKLLKELNGFDERYFMYAEDADLCKRIRKKYKIMCYPECQVVHKWEKASHKNFKLFRIHCASLFKYFRKWGWRLW